MHHSFIHSLRARAISVYKTVLRLGWRTIAVAVCSLALMGYGMYAYLGSEATETLYTLGRVERRTIRATISGTGQVSSGNQFDLKTKSSGEITRIFVSPGQRVSAGMTVAQLDTTEAYKSIRDAQASLESAQIALEKAKKPASDLSLTQASNALSSAEDSLTKAYSDSHTHIINVYLNLPTIIADLESILMTNESKTNLTYLDYYKTNLSAKISDAQAQRDAVYDDFIAAKREYESSFKIYQALGSNPSNESIEQAIESSYVATQKAAKAVKSANAFVTLYIDTMTTYSFNVHSSATSARSTLATHTTTMNNHYVTLGSDKSVLSQSKKSIIEKKQSLASIADGPDVLDVRSAELAVTRAKNTLTDAYVTLANTTVKAPFAGTIAEITATRFEQVGSGASIGTLITKERIAELSMNEVDVARVSVGDRSVLTFDALDDVTVEGSVVEIGTLGAVTQGVVSYTVKISFPAQDNIMPGMTVNAEIVTDIRENVLTLPVSPVKGGDAAYVEVPPSDYAAAAPATRASSTLSRADRESRRGERASSTASSTRERPNVPQHATTTAIAIPEGVSRITVSTGVSDERFIEILEGVEEGDVVVIRSQTATAASAGATTQTPSLMNSLRVGGPGGGATRAR